MKAKLAHLLLVPLAATAALTLAAPAAHASPTTTAVTVQPSSGGQGDWQGSAPGTGSQGDGSQGTGSQSNWQGNGSQGNWQGDGSQSDGSQGNGSQGDWQGDGSQGNGSQGNWQGGGWQDDGVLGELLEVIVGGAGECGLLGLLLGGCN